MTRVIVFCSLVLFSAVAMSQNVRGRLGTAETETVSTTRIVVTATAGETQEKEVDGCGGDDSTPIRLKVEGSINTLGFFKCGNDVIRCVVESDNKCDAELYPKSKNNKGTCGVAATRFAPAIAICEYANPAHDLQR